MSVPLPRLAVHPSPFHSLEGALLADPAAAAGAALLRGVDGGVPDLPVTTAFSCYWTAASLVVLFSVSGSAAVKHHALIMPAETACTPSLWELSEVVEVFVGADARETGRYREFEVAPDGRWIALEVQTGSTGVRADQPVTGFRCAIAASPGGIWKAALEIPWREIGGKNPVCHGNFYRSVPGAGELYAWSPTGSGPQCFHRPERFGELVIVP